MSGHALDDKGSLQYRLALGAATATATSKGGRGTLTRSAQNLLGGGDLLELLRRSSSAKDNASSPAPEDRRRDAARELRLLQVEMNKMLLVLNRIKRETQQLEEEPNGADRDDEHDGGGGRDFKALSRRVHELRYQVGTAQQAQACQVEYEALATLLHRRHATPQHVLQSQVDSIDRQMDAATRELQQKQSTLKVRTAQVSALVQSILDLKQSLLTPSEGGNEISEEIELSSVTSSFPNLSASSAKGKSESSSLERSTKKRRRHDSGDAEWAGTSRRPDASTPDRDSGMEEGEASTATMAQDGKDKGGNDGDEEEEELYGDL